MPGQRARFSIYGRFVLEVKRENGRWIPYRLGEGKRRPEPNLAVPAELAIGELAGFLDDVYHELAHPGARIERIDRARDE